MEHHTTGDERTVHRLEAFSDIVIGFCIAQMGVNLLIPKTAAELPSIVVGTNAFAISFVLIAIVWWSHHRLFKSLFVLNAVTLILNFAMLGSLVLMVYFQQVGLHFLASGNLPRTAVVLWLVAYALVFTLLATMMWIGLYVRWNALSEEDLRWGLSWAMTNSIALLIFTTFSVLFEVQGRVSALAVILLATGVIVKFAIDLVTNRLVARRAALTTPRD